MEKCENFYGILDTIQNEDIKQFCKSYLNDTPDWFFEVPASSSGKYHPSYSLGVGGLQRHTISATIFLNYLLSLEQYYSQFTDREMDLMRVAILLHDSRKQGENESKKHTVFEHPLYGAQAVMEYKCDVDLSDAERKFIAECIASHMGEWNTNKRSKVELPKPTKLHQQLVHLADYLASRREVDVDFSAFSKIQKPQAPDINTWVMDFGKHNGKLLMDVVNTDLDYLQWLKSTGYGKEPLRTFFKELGI